MQRQTPKPFFLVWGLGSAIAVLVALTGCGGQSSPPPSAPPGAQPTPTPPIGAYLEDQNSGTPLIQVSDPRPVFQAMANALVGDATGTIQKNIQMDYIIEYQQGEARLKRLGEVPVSHQLNGSVRIRGMGNIQYGGENLMLQVYSFPNSLRYYQFAYEIEIGPGVRMYSTENVALFQGPGGREFLRVAFRAPNPIFQSFFVDMYGGRGAGQHAVFFPYHPYWAHDQHVPGGMHQPQYPHQPQFPASGQGPYLHVIQKDFVANFTYRPQQQPGPQQPPQGQPNNQNPGGNPNQAPAYH